MSCRGVNCSVLLRYPSWNTPGISASCRLAKPENSPSLRLEIFAFNARWWPHGARAKAYRAYSKDRAAKRTQRALEQKRIVLWLYCLGDTIKTERDVWGGFTAFAPPCGFAMRQHAFLRVQCLLWRSPKKSASSGKTCFSVCGKQENAGMTAHFKSNSQ